MATDILQQVLTGKSSSQSVSPELLETLGKQAAQRFLRGGEALNDTIVKLASQYPGVQNEHVKRIAEFANNAVFQDMHSKNEDKNVHFDVADPGVIIRDLKDGGSPEHDGKTLSTSPSSKASGFPAVGEGDYRKPPGFQSSPSSDQGFSDLASAFAEYGRQDATSGIQGTGEAVKTASVQDHSLHANPIDDVFDTHVRLRATREKIAEVHERFDLIHKQACEDFYQAVKHECLDPDGAGMPNVIAAVKLAASNDSAAFRALGPVAERLVKEGALRPDEMSKTAHAGVVMNPEHPIFQTFAGMVSADQEREKAAAALEEVTNGMAQTTDFLSKLR